MSLQPRKYPCTIERSFFYFFSDYFFYRDICAVLKMASPLMRFLRQEALHECVRHRAFERIHVRRRSRRAPRHPAGDSRGRLGHAPVADVARALSEAVDR